MKLADRCKLEGVEVPEIAKWACDNSACGIGAICNFCALRKIILNLQVPEPREALDNYALFELLQQYHCRHIIDDENCGGCLTSHNMANHICQKFGKVKDKEC